MVPDPDNPPGMVRKHNGRTQHLGTVEESLSEAPYFAGEAFTAADVMMAYPFTTFRTIYPFDVTPYPAIASYVRRLEERPAFQKATRSA